MAELNVKSSEGPGAAIGVPDFGRTYFVASLDDIPRGEVAGYNSRDIGVYSQLIPRLSKSDYQALQVSRLPEQHGHLETLVGNLSLVPKQARDRYLATRKAVKQDLSDGTSRIVVVPRVPEAIDEIGILDLEQDASYPVGVDRFPVDDLAAREKSRKYSLDQVFQDIHVIEKYGLTMRMVETAKRMTASNGVAAARMLQNAMNSVQGRVAVTVTAGDYVKSKSQAKATIGVICSAYRPLTTTVKSDVVGERLFMYGPEGEDSWHVSGPMKYALEVSYVYWIVLAEGLIIPNVVLSMELTMLAIDVYDGFTCREPELEFHAAVDGTDGVRRGLSPKAAGVLTADQRATIESMGDKLLPVMASDGVQMATAVRVTDSHLLINSHVVDVDPMCTILEQQVIVHTQLSRDLWTVDMPGEAKPWTMREPVVGELATICYRTGDTISCSPPLKVTSIDNSCVVTSWSEEVVSGLSGGALIALSDLSLLGLHSASTLNSLISFKFGPAQFSTLLDSQSESAFSKTSDLESFAAKTYQRFKSRGLGGVFNAALNSLVPVYVSNQQVGMAVSNGEHLYTTCDADLPLRFGNQHLARVTETVQVGHVYRAPKNNGFSVDTPVYRRAPRVYEQAFVAGVDDKEPYMSAETTVQHVGPDARSFVLANIAGADRPLAGGLVIARDGAVLGICGSRSVTTQIGLGFVCWPLPDVKVVPKTDVRTALALKFPFLNMQAWSDELLEEVFTHSSAGKYSDGRVFNAGCRPLANVGDNAAKAELYASLRESGLPHSQWANRMQLVQSNTAYAEVAWIMGYAEHLITGLGATFTRASRAYADLTEAFIGAAYLIEQRPVFQELCQVMGILGDTPSFSSSGDLEMHKLDVIARQRSDEN